MARVLFSLGLLIIAAMTLVDQAYAIIIDDFSQGPFSQTGASNLVSQTALDPNHVVGGRRDFSFGRFSPPDTVEIDPNSGTFAFSSPLNYGYMTLMYGMGGPLGLDFTNDGHDRLRFRFSSVVAHPPYALWLSINRPPGGSTPVELQFGLNALDGADGILEVPYSAYPTNFSSVNTLGIDLARFPAGASFVLDEIVTAGPPIPGDYNRDGQVDTGDYDEWKRMFGRSVSDDAVMGPDGNGDGRIDSADYVFWRKHFDATSVGDSDVSVVPEPLARSLVAVAMLLLFVAGRQPPTSLVRSMKV